MGMKKGEKAKPVKRTDSMQWLADSISAELGLKKSIKQTGGFYKKSSAEADQSVKFCPECRQHWEVHTVYNPKGNREMFYKYSHITGYGKKKAVCIECK